MNYQIEDFDTVYILDDIEAGEAFLFDGVPYIKASSPTVNNKHQIMAIQTGEIIEACIAIKVVPLVSELILKTPRKTMKEVRR